MRHPLKILLKSSIHTRIYLKNSLNHRHLEQNHRLVHLLFVVAYELQTECNETTVQIFNIKDLVRFPLCIRNRVLFN